MTTPPRYVFIQPPERPSSTTMSSPALIDLAVALGEYKAISGIEFNVEQHDRLILRVTYWQDEAFIALRLKFGQWFVPEPRAVQRPPIPKSAKSAKSALPPPPVRAPEVDGWYDLPDDYAGIWQRYTKKPPRSRQDIAEIAKKAIEKMQEENRVKSAKARRLADLSKFVDPDPEPETRYLRKLVARFR